MRKNSVHKRVYSLANPINIVTENPGNISSSPSSSPTSQITTKNELFNRKYVKHQNHIIFTDSLLELKTSKKYEKKYQMQQSMAFFYKETDLLIYHFLDIFKSDILVKSFQNPETSVNLDNILKNISINFNLNNENLKFEHLLQISIIFKMLKKIIYFEKVEENDKIALIRNSWTEILIFIVCFRSMFSIRNEEICFLTGYLTNECFKEEHLQTKKPYITNNHYTLLRDHINFLVFEMKKIELTINQGQYILAIIIYNSITRETFEKEEIAGFKQLAYCQLGNLFESNNGANQNTKFAQVLLLLASIKAIAMQCINDKFPFFVKVPKV